MKETDISKIGDNGLVNITTDVKVSFNKVR